LTFLVFLLKVKMLHAVSIVTVEGVSEDLNSVEEKSRQTTIWEGLSSKSLVLDSSTLKIVQDNTLKR